MNSRRWIIVSIVLVAMIIVASGTIYFVSHKEPTDETASQTSSYTGRERVFVADLYEYVDTETKKSIERALFENIDKDQPDLYTGTIRKDSVSKTILSSGQTESTLLIDTIPTEVAYRVTLFSDPRGGRPSVNIECAPKGQQLNPSIICKDIHHHE